ncbi:uncharacterized protein N7515_004514 [Penicillium bovifimosum]|uniref:Hemerythrin-like domain-containing protein n=1 Tax=Penicillium bovifimosum TaxID=126998 RepID=A0A9W9H089_9EURO|nr:uncharacterized protein N7515_004514 [Penicillium bovifimosum]KAJ5135236.1 hypothetical protein N7515_004514 [Penicillium bovifimosum]
MIYSYLYFDTSINPFSSFMLRRAHAIHSIHHPTHLPSAHQHPMTTTPRPKTQCPNHFLGGNIHPSLQTFTSSAATPIAHSRILPAIKHDHLELEAHSQKILHSTNKDEKTRYRNQFTWELARHLIGEELVVYSALVSALADGQQIADRNRIEHQGIKQQLKTFQDLSSTDPQFLPTLRGLMRDLGDHVRHEEDVELPRLEEVLSKEESVELTRHLDRMKIFVPSRSHPLAPTEPFFETAVGLLTAPIDHVADLFRKWPDGKKKKKG